MSRDSNNMPIYNNFSLTVNAFNTSKIL